MNQAEFENKLRALLMPEDGDRDYELKETEAVNLIKALVWDAASKSGDTWDNEVAGECYKQFEWLHGQP